MRTMKPFSVSTSAVRSKVKYESALQLHIRENRHENPQLLLAAYKSVAGSRGGVRMVEAVARLQYQDFLYHTDGICGVPWDDLRMNSEDF